MRNGRSMGTYDVEGMTTQEMSKAHGGAWVSLKFDKKEQHLTDNVFLKVRNLTVHNSQGVMKVDDLSFDVKAEKSWELQVWKATVRQSSSTPLPE